VALTKATNQRNVLLLLAIAGTLVVAPTLILSPQSTQAQEGQPGGPRQMPGEPLGCHFPNPAGKVNVNPIQCGYGGPLPDCGAYDIVGAVACRPSSGHEPF
jgi:hypothetical protein